MFQDGSNGKPANQHHERAGAQWPRPQGRTLRSSTATTANQQAVLHPRLCRCNGLCWFATSSRAADQLEPFRIRPRRIAGLHPLPSRQFQALFNSLFKVLFIFPSRYLFAIGLSRPYLALDGIYHPIRAAFPNNPTRRQRPRGAAGSRPDGAVTLSGAPFQGTWARSAAKDASTDYNSGDAATPIFMLGSSRFARRY